MMTYPKLVKWLKRKQPTGPWFLLVHDQGVSHGACLIYDLHEQSFRDFAATTYAAGLSIHLRQILARADGRSISASDTPQAFSKFVMANSGPGDRIVARNGSEIDVFTFK